MRSAGLRELSAPEYGPGEPAENAGITFVLALFGTPTCLFLGVLKDDGVLLAPSIFWLIVGSILFFYVALAAKYWREHRAIISEELRRYGRVTLG